MKLTNGEYWITDDKSDVDVESVKQLLADTYWAGKRPIDVLKRSIANSICFSLYRKERQIGFARIVTDYSTFAYLADVIIENDFRGKGLGKWFVNTVVSDERWCGLRLMLVTKDAHELYGKFGFEKSERLMTRKKQ